MELLFVVLGGALLGFVAHFALPAQDTRGVLRPDAGWIWVASLVLAGVVAILVCRVTATSRRRRDSALLARLLKG
jgi:uncharacterized membrane protein